MHKIEKVLKNKTKIIKDGNLKLENNSLTRKLFNFFSIPILNILPIKSRGLIKKSNKAVGDIVDNATTHKALEILYQRGKSHSVKRIYERVAHKVWFSTNNSKAVRNRLKIVTKEISDIIKGKLDSGIEEINILSIAAGSARAVIEALNSNLSKDTKINVTFVDKSNEALKYSQELISDYEIYNNKNYTFTWIEDTVNGFLDKSSNNFHLVEMVGLMDYFSDDKALNIFKKIYELLAKDGYFITANINNNSEKKFVTKAIGWPMVYRSAEHIGRLVHESGFPHLNIDVYYEPLKIHSIIVARRES